MMQSIYTLQRKTEIVDRLKEAIILVDFRAGEHEIIAKAENELDEFISNSLSIDFDNIIKAIYEAAETTEPYCLKYMPPLKDLLDYMIYGGSIDENSPFHK